MTRDDARAREVAAVNNWTPDRPTKPGNVPTNNLGWTKVTERLPPYQENIRVLIYTEGVEFNGVQFFDVPADSLYGDADDLEEAQRHATHWMLLTDLRLPYVEPPDPFAEPVPSLRERVEAGAAGQVAPWHPDYPSLATRAQTLGWDGTGSLWGLCAWAGVSSENCAGPGRERGIASTINVLHAYITGREQTQSPAQFRVYARNTLLRPRMQAMSAWLGGLGLLRGALSERLATSSGK
jgi:hypothetical protein